MQRWLIVVRRAGRRYSSGGCGFLAQAIAFNAFFAIFPLLLLASAGVGYVFGTEDGQARVIAVVDSLAPAAHALLADQIRHVVSFRGASGFIGFVTLLWSGKSLFGALAYALDHSLGTQRPRPLLDSIVLSLIMVPIVGTLLLIATVLPVALSFLSHAHLLPAWLGATEFAGYVTSFAMVFLGTAIMYRYLPTTRLPFRYGIPGALFAAFAFEGVQILFAAYTLHTNLTQVYGTVSTIVALLLWFNLIGMIFLFGAQLSAEWAEEHAAVPR